MGWKIAYHYEYETMGHAGYFYGAIDEKTGTVNGKLLFFWPRVKLKGPKRSFVVVRVVVDGESFRKEQKMCQIERKMFHIEQIMLAITLLQRK